MPAEPAMLTGLGLEWEYWMMRGEFERAWEVSDRILGAVAPRLDEVRGKRVLVRCEHGLGDTIQYIRYAPLLRPLVARLLVHAQPRLLPLLRGMTAIDHLFTWGEEWPNGQYDVEIEIMDLPHLFRTTLDSIPGEVPYLAVDGGAAPDGHDSGRLRLGVQCCCGDWDPNKALPAETRSAPREVPGVEVVDLEQGLATPDVAATAAAVLATDLVIAPDTMVAHLAGALGRPVWVLLPYEANWRWMLDRDDSPWYRTMRLFRQDAGRQWLRPLERVLAELRRIAPEGG